MAKIGEVIAQSSTDSTDICTDTMKSDLGRDAQKVMNMATHTIADGRERGLIVVRNKNTGTIRLSRLVIGDKNSIDTITTLRSLSKEDSHGSNKLKDPAWEWWDIHSHPRGISLPSISDYKHLLSRGAFETMDVDETAEYLGTIVNLNFRMEDIFSMLMLGFEFDYPKIPPESWIDTHGHKHDSHEKMQQAYLLEQEERVDAIDRHSDSKVEARLRVRNNIIDPITSECVTTLHSTNPEQISEIVDNVPDDTRGVIDHRID